MCIQPVRSLMNATDLPSGDTSTRESRPVGENHRSSVSFHSVRVVPLRHALISRVLPFADPSAQTNEPSAENCTELGLPTTGIHAMSPPDADTTPSRRSTAPPDTTPLLLPMMRVMSPLNGSSPGSAGRPAPVEINAIDSPSNEKTGFRAVSGAMPV